MNVREIFPGSLGMPALLQPGVRTKEMNQCPPLYWL
jgi:hypothetical protein